MMRRPGLARAVALPSTAPAKRGGAGPGRFCTGDAATFRGDGDRDDERDAGFARHRQDLSGNCRGAVDAYRAGGGR